MKIISRRKHLTCNKKIIYDQWFYFKNISQKRFIQLNILILLFNTLIDYDRRELRSNPRRF